MKRSPFGPTLAGSSVAAGAVGLILGVVFLVETKKDGPRPTPRFQTGQMVQMVAFGTAGMVVRQACYRDTPSCYYTVRFSALQLRTDTRVFGGDGPISIAPISLVNDIAEFELRAAK